MKHRFCAAALAAGLLLSAAPLSPAASAAFSDAEGTWAAEVIEKAEGYGLMNGYPDGTFRPSGSITRAEVAVIVNHMLGRTPDQSFVDRSLDRLVSFSDLNSSHWAFYPIMEASNSHEYSRRQNYSEYWTKICPGPDWGAIEK